jgi:hypothetical protein
LGSGFSNRGSRHCYIGGSAVLRDSLKLKIHAQFLEVGKAVRFYMSDLENVIVAGKTFGEFLVTVNKPFTAYWKC